MSSAVGNLKHTHTKQSRDDVMMIGSHHWLQFNLRSATVENQAQHAWACTTHRDGPGEDCEDCECDECVRSGQLMCMIMCQCVKGLSSWQEKRSSLATIVAQLEEFEMLS